MEGRVTGSRFRSVNHLVIFIKLILGAACTLGPFGGRAFTVIGIAAVVIWTPTLMKGRRGSLEDGFISCFIETLVLGVLLILVCLSVR